QGRLLDAETATPIESGTMTLLSADSVPVQTVLTNEQGEFTLSAPSPGGYRLAAERIGYRSSASPVLELEEDDELRVEFLVSTEAVVLQPLTVVVPAERTRGQLSGFYERMERGLGTFIDRERIESMNPIRASDLLRMVPGVHLVPTSAGRSVILMRGRCVPLIYLDGMRIRTTSIDDLVNVWDLEGIEVYRGLEVPAEFSHFSDCGAIVLWTRRGS